MFALLALALAQETPPPEAPDLEILVEGERVRIARYEREKTLEDLGYTGKRQGDRIVYTHHTGWRQRVVLHDSGFVSFRHRPPNLKPPPTPEGAWWADRPVLQWTPCIAAPFTCISPGSLPIRPQLKEQDKERTLSGAQPQHVAYADALAAEALAKNIGLALPMRLDSIWYEGFDPIEKIQLETHTDRRQAILEIWLSRTDNEYGDAVREAIEVYIQYEVQTSDHPFTDTEVRTANTVRKCARPFQIETPSGP